VSAKPTFRKILQVGLVVKDSEATARRYWKEFGIGPWRFYTLDPSNTPGMSFRGKPVKHAFRAALASIGDVTLELIEPLTGSSVYAEHLATRGEGLHHLAFAVEDYDGACEYLRSHGYDEVQRGRPFDVNDYSYFDTSPALRFIMELCSEEAPDKPFPPPERTWPPGADG
jgi:catechol 2,3-dioxygenase-like lactoylglutathione lyase family enzyme